MGKKGQNFIVNGRGSSLHCLESAERNVVTLLEVKGGGKALLLFHKIVPRSQLSHSSGHWGAKLHDCQLRGASKPPLPSCPDFYPRSHPPCNPQPSRQASAERFDLFPATSVEDVNALLPHNAAYEAAPSTAKAQNSLWSNLPTKVQKYVPACVHNALFDLRGAGARLRFVSCSRAGDEVPPRPAPLPKLWQGCRSSLDGGKASRGAGY